ncbi:MAG: hypothetical protein CVU77_01875 [Elusimicrobia bacterium HGW-Elusimicrobia-1]|jgi:glycosyltransferase involved in cell wall biosynthesis|nr:MAG: hypothetical protein CVU77_01875 [Elusimicrobia bacterium HGW-Elusimicrobia-1]
MVSIVIPVYNEEATVEKVLREIESAMRQTQFDYEIIIVDDASVDRSKEIIKNCDVKVKLYENSSNRGYGASIKTGIANAIYDLILIVDADGTYPISDIQTLLKESANHDMVVGSRTGQNVVSHPLRKIAKWFIRKLAILLTGTNIPDLNSGFRVMKKSVAEKFIHLLPDGFSLTSTITVAMLTNKYSVKYIPVDYYSRKGKSKISPINDTLNFIQLIIRMVLYFDPLKIFIPLSLFLVLLATSVFFISWLLFGLIMNVTVGIIMMTAVAVMSIGMLADLIDKRLR